MKLHLTEIRKQAGYRSRDSFAEKIGVNKYTYRSWESGAAMMNLEQAYNCAVALGCTLNDLVGMNSTRVFADPDQQKINDQYEDLNDRGRIQAVEQIDNIHSNKKNLKRDGGQDPANSDSGREILTA